MLGCQVAGLRGRLDSDLVWCSRCGFLGDFVCFLVHVVVVVKLVEEVSQLKAGAPLLGAPEEVSGVLKYHFMIRQTHVLAKSENSV